MTYQHGDYQKIVAFSALLNKKPRELVYVDFYPAIDEYRVCKNGDPESRAYYTDDRKDAEGTARAEHGADCKIVHRRKTAPWCTE